MTKAAPAVRPISVAYVSPSWPPGDDANGIVMYIGEITGGLRDKGHTTSVLAQRVIGGPAPEGVYDLGRFRGRRGLARRLLDRVEFHARPERFGERETRRLIVAATRQLVAERGAQLLEMEESFGWPLRIHCEIPIPLVVRLHGPWFLNGPAQGVADDAAFRRRVRVEGEAIRLAAGVSASSHDVLEQARSYYGLALERAEVIHPPAPAIPAEGRWRLTDCDRRRLLFVGRFDRHKGADVMIEAFARLVREIPEARLWFVGPDRGIVDDSGRSWTLEDFLRDRIPDPAARDRVEWLGQQPNSVVMRLRSEALVSVVSSRYDNFPTTVTEAMAMGCPIVATRTGGIPEQIDHEVSGLLCAPGDPDDLADALRLLLDDPARAERLGHEARLKSEATLALDVIAGKMAEFYGRVLEEHHRPAR